MAQVSDGKTMETLYFRQPKKKTASRWRPLFNVLIHRKLFIFVVYSPPLACRLARAHVTSWGQFVCSVLSAKKGLNEIKRLGEYERKKSFGVSRTKGMK